MPNYIKRHELWRQSYRKIRYMELLSQEELKERFEVLLDNCLSITAGNDLKPTISPIPFQSEPQWFEIITHVFEECVLRGYSYPGPLAHPKHRGFLDKVNFEQSREIFKKTGLENGTFKLGKIEHLIDMRAKGVLRVCPATYYGKGNYGYAIDDNEVEKFLELNHRNSEIVNLLDGFKLHDFIKYNIRIPIVAPTDYYLFSMSRTFRARHIFDFGYNACLQISDRQAFIKRMRTAVKEKFGNSYEFEEINVNYVDPLRPKNGEKYIAMSMKHLKFSYQTEFRVCLIPKEKVKDLGDPIFLSIGPIDDISEIIPFEPPAEAIKDKLFAI